MVCSRQRSFIKPVVYPERPLGLLRARDLVRSSFRGSMAIGPMESFVHVIQQIFF